MPPAQHTRPIELHPLLQFTTIYYWDCTTILWRLFLYFNLLPRKKCPPSQKPSGLTVRSGAVSDPGYLTRTYLSRITDFDREVHANSVNQHFFLPPDFGWEMHANSVVGACWHSAVQALVLSRLLKFSPLTLSVTLSGEGTQMKQYSNPSHY